MTNSQGQRDLETDLLAWGRVIRIETRGRRSGLPRQATVGFAEEPDGSLVVAASSEFTQWALNLIADSTCVVEREGVARVASASQLAGPEQHSAVQALILKYGTPSEKLGPGPAFRLRLDADHA